MESVIPEEQEQQVPGAEEELFRELYWEAGTVVLQLCGSVALRMLCWGRCVPCRMCVCIQRGADTETVAELCTPLGGRGSSETGVSVFVQCSHGWKGVCL